MTQPSGVRRVAHWSGRDHTAPPVGPRSASPVIRPILPSPQPLPAEQMGRRNNLARLRSNRDRGGAGVRCYPAGRVRARVLGRGFVCRRAQNTESGAPVLMVGRGQIAGYVCALLVGRRRSVWLRTNDLGGLDLSACSGADRVYESSRISATCAGAVARRPARESRETSKTCSHTTNASVTYGHVPGSRPCSIRGVGPSPLTLRWETGSAQERRGRVGPFWARRFRHSSSARCGGD